MLPNRKKFNEKWYNNELTNSKCLEIASLEVADILLPKALSLSTNQMTESVLVTKLVMNINFSVVCRAFCTPQKN